MTHKNSDIFSLDVLSHEVKVELMHEITRPYADIVCGENSHDKMTGSMRFTIIDNELLITQSDYVAPYYKRLQRHVLQMDSDYFILKLITRGKIKGNFGNRSVEANLGDIYLVDPRRTFEYHSEPGGRYAVYLERKYINERFPNCDLHGLVLKAANPMTLMLSRTIVSFFNLSKKLTTCECYALKETIASLLAAGLGRVMQETPETIVIIDSTTRERAMQFIDANIRCSELSIEMICKHLRISRAHLYRAFSQDEGIMKIIRNRRLDLVYRELADGKTTRSISQIAYESGFSSSAQLLRVFVEQYGITPSQAKWKSIKLPPKSGGIISLDYYFSEVSLNIYYSSLNKYNSN